MTHDRSEARSPKVSERRNTEDKKRDKDSPPTKVVIRRLPPTLTPEIFLEQVSPLPKYDFFYFVKADMSLGQHAFTRAYINFQNGEEMYTFRDKFDGYIFVDNKGNEYPAIVEFSPFQKVPKKKAKKPDTKKGTLEQDSDYQKFLETLQNPEPEPASTIESYLEEIEQREREMKANHGCPKMTTPLIEYLKRRREEKKVAIQKIREERKRRELERRRLKEEEKRKRKEKEKLIREKEKMREKDVKDKEKEKDKDSGKEKETKKDELPVKLLKNPEREKEEKEPVKPKEEKPTGRENLRFSKENREREKAKSDKQREAERPKSGRDGRNSDKGRSSKEEKFSDRPDKYEKSFDKSRPGKDERSEKSRSYRDDRPSDRPRSARNDRDRDRRDERSKSGSYGRKQDSYYDDRPPRGGHEDRKRSTGDRYDDRPKSGGSNSDSKRKQEGPQNRDERRDDRREDRSKSKSGSDEKKKPQESSSSETVSTKKESGQGDSSRPERERNKVDNKSGVKCKEDTKCEVVTDVKPKAGSQSGMSKTEEGGRGTPQRDSGDKGDNEEKKRRRRDRPERQIYVPRRALERQKQETGKEEKVDKGQSSEKTEPEKSQD